MPISRIVAIAAASTIISGLARAQDKEKTAAPTSAAVAAPAAAAATPAAAAAAPAADAVAPAAAAAPGATTEVPANSPCAEDIEALCKGIKPGEGDVLRCLADKSGELSSACKKRLEQLKKDFLSSAADCEPDVQSFCATVPHTGGRMAQCLKRHEKELSAPCRALQAKLKETAHAPQTALPAKSPEAGAPGPAQATASSSIASTPAATAAPAAAAAPAADPAAPATTPPAKK